MKKLADIWESYRRFERRIHRLDVEKNEPPETGDLAKADEVDKGKEAGSADKVDKGKSAVSAPDEIALKLSRWFDGTRHWIAQLADRSERNRSSELVVLAICLNKNPTEDERLLFDLPWELLAEYEAGVPGRDKLGEYVTNRGVVIVRSVASDHQARTETSESCPLSGVLMVAAPESTKPVDIDAYERQIGQRVSEKSFEVFTEGTGTLAGLQDIFQTRSVEDKKTHVCHVVCAGATGPVTPGYLLLECFESYRQTEKVTAQELANAFPIESRPGVVFVDVPYSGNTREAGSSFCEELLYAGIPAALGWAGEVDTPQALEIARRLYAELKIHRSVFRAVLRTRQNLAKKKGEAWHRLRLYSSELDDHVLTTEVAAANSWSRNVPGWRSFAGRRREIRECIREIRRGRNVIIYGGHGQGKALIRQRLLFRLRHFLHIELDGTRLDGSGVSLAIMECLERCTRPDAGGLWRLGSSARDGTVSTPDELWAFLQEALRKKLWPKLPIIVSVDNIDTQLIRYSDNGLPRHRLQRSVAGYLNVLARMFQYRGNESLRQSQIVIVTSYMFDLSSLCGEWSAVELSSLDYTEIDRCVSDTEHKEFRSRVKEGVSNWYDKSEHAERFEWRSWPDHLFTLTGGNLAILGYFLDNMHRSHEVLDELAGLADSRHERKFKAIGLSQHGNPDAATVAALARSESKLIHDIHDTTMFKFMHAFDAPIPEFVISSLEYFATASRGCGAAVGSVSMQGVGLLRKTATADDAFSGHRVVLKEECDVLVDLGALERVPDLVDQNSKALLVSPILRLRNEYRGEIEAIARSVLHELDVAWSKAKTDFSRIGHLRAAFEVTRLHKLYEAGAEGGAPGPNNIGGRGASGAQGRVPDFGSFGYAAILYAVYRGPEEGLMTWMREHLQWMRAQLERQVAQGDELGRSIWMVTDVIRLAGAIECCEHSREQKEQDKSGKKDETPLKSIFPGKKLRELAKGYFTERSEGRGFDDEFVRVAFGDATRALLWSLGEAERQKLLAGYAELELEVLDGNMSFEGQKGRWWGLQRQIESFGVEVNVQLDEVMAEVAAKRCPMHWSEALVGELKEELEKKLKEELEKKLEKKLEDMGDEKVAEHAKRLAEMLAKNHAKVRNRTRKVEDDCRRWSQLRGEIIAGYLLEESSCWDIDDGAESPKPG